MRCFSTQEKLSAGHAHGFARALLHRHRAHSASGPRHQRSQRGAAAVEFALVLPLLLVLLIGGIDMSLALYDKAVITNASREGARAGIVARNPPISEAEIRQVVQAYTQSALVNFGPEKPQPSVSVEQGSLGADLTLKVSVNYTFQGIGLGDLFSSLGQPWVLSGEHGHGLRVKDSHMKKKSTTSLTRQKGCSHRAGGIDLARFGGSSRFGGGSGLPPCGAQRIAK